MLSTLIKYNGRVGLSSKVSAIKASQYVTNMNMGVLRFIMCFPYLFNHTFPHTPRECVAGAGLNSSAEGGGGG